MSFGCHVCLPRSRASKHQNLQPGGSHGSWGPGLWTRHVHPWSWVSIQPRATCSMAVRHAFVSRMRASSSSCSELVLLQPTAQHTSWHNLDYWGSFAVIRAHSWGSLGGGSGGRSSYPMNFYSVLSRCTEPNTTPTHTSRTQNKAQISSG